MSAIVPVSMKTRLMHTLWPDGLQSESATVLQRQEHLFSSSRHPFTHSNTSLRNLFLSLRLQCAPGLLWTEQFSSTMQRSDTEHEHSVHRQFTKVLLANTISSVSSFVQRGRLVRAGAVLKGPCVICFRGTTGKGKDRETCAAHTSQTRAEQRQIT